MKNTPEIKIAIVGVSRDCFPAELTKRRLAALMADCKKQKVDAFACGTIVENESDALAALDEAKRGGANAAVIYLGNFGPEAPLAIFAQKFDGPVMACAAAEESGKDLINGRGDAYCGLLNASYNFALRNLRVFIPEKPVGLPARLAQEIARFAVIAKIVVGVKALKVFAFGPRPHDFFACNAPIKALYDMGVEVMENSELDLYELFSKAPAETHPEVKAVAADMARELGRGNAYPDLLPRLARYELALVKFMEQNMGSRNYAVFANKCWPAFEKAFEFVPCFINSRLAGRGIPVACEVDIYGAVSEYMAQVAADHPATLLDINNTVPVDLTPKSLKLYGAAIEDLFMGFHCGNTPSACMKNCSMKFQLIMNRLMEDPKKKPNITRGTLEGTIRPGEVTVFRVQGRAEGGVSAYAAQGRVLDVDPRTFGGTGVFAIPEFARFYRHVLVGKHFPHHCAVSFAHRGGVLFDALKLLGVNDVNVPLPAGVRYPQENPFV
jgi:L-fucose isomerase-like protein